MSFNKVKTLFILSILFSLCCLPNLLYADTLQTTLSRDKIALGETVTVSYYLNKSATRSRPDFSPLEKDFRIISTNYGTSINVLNGVTNAQTFWQVTLEPKTAGDLLIPEIDFGNVKSLSRKLYVEEVAGVVSRDPQNASAFVQAEIDNAAPYIQSQVLYTFKLFYRSQLENPRLEPPHIKDVTLLQIGDNKFYQTTIKGERFFVFEKNFAIFPQKPGKLIIPPTHFRASQLDISNLMNDPFFVTPTKIVTLATQPFALDVQKIPNNFQGKIWLPAKKISLTEEWSSDPNKWEIGNPVTRTVTIEAHGLRADQIPDLSVENISGVNIYADRPHRSNNLKGDSVVGILQQKITYIPNQPQSVIIPALKFHWWNTQTNTNAIAQLKTLRVQVQGKINTAGSTPSNTGPISTTIGTTDQTSNLSQNKSLPVSTQQTGSIINETIPFYFSMWFWVSIFLFVMWLITLIWIWKNSASKKTQLKSLPAKDNESEAKSIQWNSKTFVKACKQGNPVLAQKLLLLWANTQWQDPPRSLGKLREMINDENFKKALENLEQALYANKDIQWNGHALLTAYQQAHKNKSHIGLILHKGKTVANHQTSDPLPPLYPS